MIQLRRIGDVLMTTPTVAALRGAFPQAHLAFLTEPPATTVLALDPNLDEVIPYSARASVAAHLRMALHLRRGRFDTVLDFFSNPRTAQLTWASGASRRIGFDFRGRRYAYTERVATPQGRHYAGKHKALLAGALGVSVEDLRPRITLHQAHHDYADRQLYELSVQPGELLVALSPVSRQRYRLWPAKRFARIADVLIERYQARVLLMWGPGEEHFVDAVRLEMAHQALPSYPVPPLLEMAALLERCHLYVGNDSGPRHIAIAVGTPTVTPFGRSHPENWTPPGLAGNAAVAYDPGCKAACTWPRCDHLNCINGVEYKPVEAAVESLLEELLAHDTPD